MSITPKAIQVGNVQIPPPTRKAFHVEGEALEHALTKSLHVRNEATKDFVLGRLSAQTRSRTDAPDVFRRSPAEQDGS